MTSSDDFFSDVKRAQSALKHAILRDYLATFAGATGTNSPGHRVGFIDGYAGPGQYVDETSGQVVEGSPRIALGVAKHHAEMTDPRHLKCIFIEKRKSYFESLKDLVAAAPTSAEAMYGDVQDHLAAAVGQFSSTPLLVFLDPFGAALDRDATIQAVFQRGDKQPTEVLLNFSVETIRRAGPRIRETEDKFSRDKTVARMDGWLGGDWWQEYFLDSSLDGNPDGADIAANRVTNEYARRIHASTGAGVFSTQMRRSASHKAIFTLMLFYPRSLAAFKYNESVSRAQDKWRETMWDMDVNAAARIDALGLTLGQSEAEIVRQAADADKVQFKADTIATIKATIQNTLSTQASVSVEKEFRKVFGEAAGVGRSLHLRAAWDELTAESVTRARNVTKFDRAVIHRADARVWPSF